MRQNLNVWPATRTFLGNGLAETVWLLLKLQPCCAKFTNKANILQFRKDLRVFREGMRGKKQGLKYSGTVPNLRRLTDSEK